MNRFPPWTLSVEGGFFYRGAPTIRNLGQFSHIRSYSKLHMNYTSDPLSVATSAATPAEFMRLPKPKARDPIFGFSRSYINTLVLPCKENGFRPPVRSIVLRKRGAKTGVRLVDLASLRAFLDRNVEPSFLEATAPYVPGPDADK